MIAMTRSVFMSSNRVTSEKVTNISKMRSAGSRCVRVTEDSARGLYISIFPQIRQSTITYW